MNKEDYGFIIGIPNRKGGAKSMFRFSTLARVRVSRVEESVEDHIDNIEPISFGGVTRRRMTQ